MENKPSRPLFAQAINQVKKQYQSSEINKMVDQSKTNQKIHNDDMSSGEQQRLMKMGVNIKKTKNITKSDNRSKVQQKWKHNKFNNQVNKQKISKASENWIITFKSQQNVKEILKLIGSEKAFISQIDGKRIKFSRQNSFQTCKSRLLKEGIKFVQPTQSQNNIKKQSTRPSEQTKKNIFEELLK